METQDASQKVDEAVTGISAWWNNPETHEMLIERPIKILLILIVAMVLNWLANKIIRRTTHHGIERSQALITVEGRSEQQVRAQQLRREQRLTTLSNVGRSVAAIVIWAWAVLAILDQLGVNVAPLIASAGVVGVAIGFGAQSLVKDFFSGMFILIENQFGVGDTIQVGDVVGDVEEMTLRITTLRDIDGALWYIRNGDIDQVGNHSARFSTARLQIPVSVMADPDKVSATIEATAKRAIHDEPIRDLVMGEPEMLGASEFNPTYVSFRLAVKTMPGQQWTVARYLNHRILKDLHSEDVVLTAMDSVLVELKENNGN
ncbi:mechanosensitive ion channel family protein [Corynebacterium lujinxingii]|uniref:Mechanosensitive ion channel family protein n=1 Tax=Corynebacterium lujinxingii TaxID=2763010 RepID=A0A7H0JXS0_9CORY|nr:mechanosensitive ion channel family protein [Corynebacterium lujinxingii]MBC3177716.1 mechanosensitive ion channel family protein [Corynebacterium lujinxingii]NNO10039.1 mechanosensitive ion channel [Corynebacterium lujinxingii]QNP89836.1 mechanosensitive ion channel family protein [Corynebacterium lujinxingii]